MSGLDWAGAIEDVRAAATWLKSQVQSSMTPDARNGISFRKVSVYKAMPRKHAHNEESPA